VTPDVQKIIDEFLDEGNLNNDDINKSIDKFNNILLKAADISLNRKKKASIKGTTTNKKQNKQEWYDQSLISARRNLNDKWNLLNKYNKDPIVRSNFFSSLKQFRKLRKEKYREYKHAIINKLDNLKENDPKEYWRLLDKLKHLDGASETSANNVSPTDNWYNYFKSLNTSTSSN